MTAHDWDPDGVSRSFQYRAESTERYLKEIGPKVQGRATYEMVHDMHLAEFWVYNSLHGKRFLQSKAALIAELKRMLATAPPQENRAHDRSAFIRHWNNTVRHELKNLLGGTV